MTMTAFRCIAIETETAERFRRTGCDDAGNTLRRVTAQSGGGYPCRHCLRLAVPGEEMLLGSYHLPRPKGIYWTPSPIFLHAEACARFEAESEIAPTVRANPLVSVRAYDAQDQCLYDLGQVCSGQDVDAPLERALDDARTAFVSVHTARPGCMLSRVERIA
jgi:hypothetical protein